MKISKSKKELARIISENGGWRDRAESSAQCSDGSISFWSDVAKKQKGEEWCGSYIGRYNDIKSTGVKLPNWHQTILSRAEYFHLYPAPDADGWIKWNGGECPVGEDAIVDIEFHFGSIIEARAAKSLLWDVPVKGHGSDIKSYRLHKPEQAPAAVEAPTIEQLAAEYRNSKNYAERKQEEADAAKADADARLKALELAGEELGLMLSVTTKPVFTGKFHSAKHGDKPSSLDVICDGCGKRFGTHVGFDCRP